MKILLTAFTLMLPFFLKAQNCFTSKDEQSGKIIKSGITELKNDSIGLKSTRFVFFKVDNELSICLTCVCMEPLDSVDMSKMKVSLNFSNGSSREYRARQTSKALKLPGGIGLIFEQSITDADLAYFHANTIVQFTLRFNGEGSAGITIPISESTANQIISSLSCLNAKNK